MTSQVDWRRRAQAVRQDQVPASWTFDTASRGLTEAQPEHITKFRYPYYFFQRSPGYSNVDPMSKPGSVADAGSLVNRRRLLCL